MAKNITPAAILKSLSGVYKFPHFALRRMNKQSVQLRKALFLYVNQNEEQQKNNNPHVLRHECIRRRCNPPPPWWLMPLHVSSRRRLPAFSRIYHLAVISPAMLQVERPRAWPDNASL
jgi:hypothetical protein